MQGRSRATLLVVGIATAAAGFALGRISSPAPEAPGGHLAGSIRAALGEGDPLERLARTSRLLERLDAEAVPGVVAVYEQMLPLLEAWELGPFFSAWARFDPAGALEHALAWPMRDRFEERRRGLRAALETWAQADPARAREKAEELAEKHPRLRGEVWSSLTTGWVRSERGPEGLAHFLAELRPARQRDEAADSAIRAQVRASGADAALPWADAILRDATQDPLFQRAVFESAARVAGGFDPGPTSAWVTGHLEAAYAEDGPLILGEEWGRRDGAAAMGWLGGTPAGERRDRAVDKAFREWSRADRPGAKAWLESVTPTAFHDPALEIWAGELIAREPVEALGWCGRIVDPARRQRCLESAAGTWYARDAVAAEAWLQQSALDEDARGKVRRTRGRGAPARRPRGGGGRL